MQITCALISSNPSLAHEMKKILCGFMDVEFTWDSTKYDDALNHLLKFKPTITFLDLDSDWERGNIFLLYHELNLYLDQLPTFVAVSKTKKYSYEVIKSGMNDYLLYPFSEFEIRKCFMRFSKTFKGDKPEKMCIRSNTDYRFIEMEDLVFLRADNNTTDLYLLNGKKVSAYKPLKFFEEELPPGFLRVHNSYIVNTFFVTRINFGKSNLTLKGYDELLPFSKSYRKKVEGLKEQLKEGLRIVA